jgi:hypothetical protein
MDSDHADHDSPSRKLLFVDISTFSNFIVFPSNDNWQQADDRQA